MKLTRKLCEYEIKDDSLEHNLINEKINYTAKNYFFLVNNYSKQIIKIENEFNSIYPNSPIKINELIYNQHTIIKELISIINKKQKEKNEIKYNQEKSNVIENNNRIENHIISFNILSSGSNYKNNFKIEPSPIYRKKIMNNLNTSFSKNDISSSFDKKINSLCTSRNDNSLNDYNKFKYLNFMPMTEKIKNEKAKDNAIQFKKLNGNNNLNSNASVENLKFKLKYKYYKPSFLNSFVSGKKIKNKKNEISKHIEIVNTDLYSHEIKKNKINKNISKFNDNNSFDSKRNGIKKVSNSLDEKNNKKNLNIYNLSIIDDCIVNNFIERANSKSKPKMNKHVKNLYLISNEIVDKFQKKIFE